MWGLWFVFGCGGDVGLASRPGPGGAPLPEDVGGFAAPVDADDVEEVPGNHRQYRDDLTWRDGTRDAVGRAVLPDDVGDALADAFFAEGTLHELRLSLPSGAATRLAQKDWVGATLSTDEGDWDVNVRLKGTTSYRDLTGKAAFRMDFNDEDPTRSYHGLRRLTLNNMMQDSSMLHEHVVYWLYRHRGVPAPRHTYAKLWVDGTYYGLYGVTETADEQLLARLFGKDNNGNLYEGNVSDFYAWKTKHFGLEETDELYPPYEDIDEVIAALDASTPDTHLATLDRLFDLDLLLRMWAIELVTTNVDGYVDFANNYLVYHGEETWYMLPWSNDQCLEWYRDVDDFSDTEGRLVLMCRESPECRARLDQEMLDLVDDWETSDMLRFAEAATALVEPLCQSDPRKEKLCDTEHVARFVRDRPATVRERLE